MNEPCHGLLKEQLRASRNGTSARVECALPCGPFLAIESKAIVSANAFLTSRVLGEFRVFHIPRSRPWPPQIDLATLRETLAYMHDDMCRVPGLEKLRDALGSAIKEAEAAERRQPPLVEGPLAAKFLPRRF